MRDSLLKARGCSVLSDGWDDIEKNHLINLIYASAGVSFFEGTKQLTSETSEDGDSVGTFLVEGIDRQVCRSRFPASYLPCWIPACINSLPLLRVAGNRYCGARRNRYVCCDEGGLEVCRTHTALDIVLVLRTTCAEPITQGHSHDT